jgi:hypothetical protein
MKIPKLTVSSVRQAVEQLLPDLDKIKSGPHESSGYDLLWNGRRLPPKVVVSRAVQIQYGTEFPESNFSGGQGAGQANTVLKKLGFEIVPKEPAALPLEIHGRYSREDIYGLEGIHYSSQKTRHLNVDLSPRCKDGGYFIFVTLNKEDLDPTHDYPDELFADKLIWVSRRDVQEGHEDYRNLRDPGCRVSLFVRTNAHERFVYAGELRYKSHKPFNDPVTGKPQLRYVWEQKNVVPDSLLRELTFGLQPKQEKTGKRAARNLRSRSPSNFDEFKKAYSYVLGSATDRTIIPEHQHYQTHLNRYLRQKGISCEMERDFIDVTFAVDEAQFIGEIKVTRNLTVPQAFRTALGQLLDYRHSQFNGIRHMVMFLDQQLDATRLALASSLAIAVVVFDGNRFVLLNPENVASRLATVFSTQPVSLAGS